MLYGIVLLIFLLLFDTGYVFANKDDISAMNVTRYQKMSNSQLLEKADEFIKRNFEDSALTCYFVIYNRKTQDLDVETLRSVYKALNSAAQIYYKHCDYKSSLELLLRALKISEEVGDKEYISRIYNNIGNIHYVFREYKTAEKYYKLAYKYNVGGRSLYVVMNNLGMLAYHQGKIDSALMLLKKSYKEQLGGENKLLCDQLSNIGLMFQVLKVNDSAFIYYRKALNNAQEFGVEEKVAKFLSSMGILFFETGKYDSAAYYLGRSNNFAEKGKLLDVLSNNMYYFAEIEYKRGNIKRMYHYNKLYSDIKDSIFSTAKYGTINELQFLYDMSKINKHILELNAEQEIKEKTIEGQRNLQFLMAVILLIIIVSFIIIYLKNRHLNRAYLDLGYRNLEIVKSDKENKKLMTDYMQIIRQQEELLDNMKTDGECENDYEHEEKSSVEPIKYGRRIIGDDCKNELLSSILDIMNNSSAFCDAEFSLNKLAEMVGSNSSYVSQVINQNFDKNFRSFINGYRIKEARRILSDPIGRKYSIASIASMVGFKSKGTFNLIFKEVTGITPSSYIKSLNDIKV